MALAMSMSIAEEEKRAQTVATDHAIASVKPPRQ